MWGGCGYVQRTEDCGLNFGYIKCELPTRDPFGNVDHTVGGMSLMFREERIYLDVNVMKV